MYLNPNMSPLIKPLASAKYNLKSCRARRRNTRILQFWPEWDNCTWFQVVQLITIHSCYYHAVTCSLSPAFLYRHWATLLNELHGRYSEWESQLLFQSLGWNFSSRFLSSASEAALSRRGACCCKVTQTLASYPGHLYGACWSVCDQNQKRSELIKVTSELQRSTILRGQGYHFIQELREGMLKWSILPITNLDPSHHNIRHAGDNPLHSWMQ